MAVDTVSRAFGVLGLLGVAVTAFIGYGLFTAGGETPAIAAVAVLALVIALFELAGCVMLYVGREYAHTAAISAFTLGAVLSFLGRNVVALAVNGLLVVGVYWRR